MIIIPTYKESGNIEVLIPRIFKYIDDVSILVIDDNSTDGTPRIVSELAETFPRLFLERRESKNGIGSAYRFGFQWALDRQFDAVVEMDADLSHRVRDLRSMISSYKANQIDLVIGSRWIRGGQVENWSTKRVLLSKIGNRYVQFALGLKIMDSTSGFRIYSRDILRNIRITEIRSEGYCFQIELVRIVSNMGGSIAEIPIVFRERVFGSSKMSLKIVLEAILLVTYWGLKRLLTNVKLIK